MHSPLQGSKHKLAQHQRDSPGPGPGSESARTRKYLSPDPSDDARSPLSSSSSGHAAAGWWWRVLGHMWGGGVGQSGSPRRWQQLLRQAQQQDAPSALRWLRVLVAVSLAFNLLALCLWLRGLVRIDTRASLHTLVFGLKRPRFIDQPRPNNYRWGSGGAGPAQRSGGLFPGQLSRQPPAGPLRRRPPSGTDPALAAARLTPRQAHKHAMRALMPRAASLSTSPRSRPSTCCPRASTSPSSCPRSSGAHTAGARPAGSSSSTPPPTTTAKVPPTCREGPARSCSDEQTNAAPAPALRSCELQGRPGPSAGEPGRLQARCGAATVTLHELASACVCLPHWRGVRTGGAARRRGAGRAGGRVQRHHAQDLALLRAVRLSLWTPVGRASGSENWWARHTSSCPVCPALLWRRCLQVLPRGPLGAADQLQRRERRLSHGSGLPPPPPHRLARAWRGRWARLSDIARCAGRAVACRRTPTWRTRSSSRSWRRRSGGSSPGPTRRCLCARSPPRRVWWGLGNEVGWRAPHTLRLLWLTRRVCFCPLPQAVAAVPGMVDFV